MNRLADEKSPYLQQHRENPVDWFPWGTEAFERAEREEKPVFLSIGYSTCHWCHVMAHESFEDDEVASLLNRYFVPIKVDREERPDVDAVYMMVCQTLTGGGGWPMTVIMTPDKKPFYAGTYLPRKSKYGLLGLTELLEKTAGLWESDRDRLIQTGQNIVDLLNRGSEEQGGAGETPEALLERGVQELKSRFDERFGGFGTAPKFPAPHNLMLLLSYGVSHSDDACLNVVNETLDNMARGGIFDQIGGGFSRYSTDDRWLVPHFEKMLYDNALLIRIYTNAFAETKKPYYREVAERALDYVRRELSSPEGAFYCGQDADSGGAEGSYYVFTKEEIANVLGKEEAETFCQWYGITEGGNFEGKSIPNLLDNDAYARTPEHIVALRTRIFDYRKGRMPLHRDDKILTSWNGMMISACAEVGFQFANEGYLEMARCAQRFLEEKLFNESGRLLVRYRDGESAFMGKLDDYAYYCLSLICLYEATFDAAYLNRASELADQMIRLFRDVDRNGFYFYGNDDEQLIHRPKEVYDGAVPSGNSVAAHVLFRLSRLTGRQQWSDALDCQVNFLASEISQFPSGYSYSLLSFEELLNSDEELVCVSSGDEVPDQLISALRRWKGHRPAVLYKCPQNASLLGEVAPFTRHYPIPEAGTLYYLCRNHVCASPVDDVGKL